MVRLKAAAQLKQALYKVAFTIRGTLTMARQHPCSHYPTICNIDVIQAFWGKSKRGGRERGPGRKGDKKHHSKMTPACDPKHWKIWINQKYKSMKRTKHIEQLLLRFSGKLLFVFLALVKICFTIIENKHAWSIRKSFDGPFDNFWKKKKSLEDVLYTSGSKMLLWLQRTLSS